MAFVFATSILSACATNAIEAKGKWYYEKISHIYFTENKANIIIIGETYHYIFETNDVLNDILSSDIKNNITLIPVVNNFQVDGHRNIKGKVLIRANKIASEEAKKWINASSSYNIRRGGIELQLNGIRYNNESIVNNATGHEMSKQYSFQIWEEPPLYKQIISKSLSPIAMAVDGTLILLASPLILLCNNCSGMAMQGGGH